MTLLHTQTNNQLAYVNMPTAVAVEPVETVTPAAKATEEAKSLAPIVPPASLADTVDTATFETSSKILRIIDRYALKRSPGAASKADEGALKFLAIIYNHVKAQKAVPMCLPAFPFKSPNAILKVLGKLPDKAEDWALAHLNGLCEAIGDVYPPGAKLTIISDGLVYNGESFQSILCWKLLTRQISSACRTKTSGLMARHCER